MIPIHVYGWDGDKILCEVAQTLPCLLLDAYILGMAIVCYAFFWKCSLEM